MASNSQIKTFLFNNKEFFYILHENKPWFGVKEIAEVVGYGDTLEDIRNHVGTKNIKLYDDSRGWQESITEGAELNKVFVNEPGLYALTSNSKTDLAKDFEDHIYNNISPSIRKPVEIKTEDQSRDEFLNIHRKLDQQGQDILLLTEQMSKMACHDIESPSKEGKEHVFILVKLNSNDEFPYKVIRSQRSYAEKKYQELRAENVNMRIILKIENIPNSIDLYVLMKEQFPIEEDDSHYTNFRIVKFSDEKLAMETIAIVKNSFPNRILITKYI